MNFGTNLPDGGSEMMSCNDCQGQIKLYFGGDLDLTRKVQLEDHLNTCASCSKSAKKLHSFMEWLGGNLPDVVRAKKVMDRISGTGKGRRRAMFLFALSASAAVILVLGAIILFQPLRQHPEKPVVRIIEGDVQVFENRFMTNQDQNGTIQLDNSTVMLEPKTELIIQEKRIINMTNGSAVFEVDRQKERFQVKTPVAEIVVLGTKFKVSLDKKGGDDMRSITIIVLAGLVQVANLQGSLTAVEGDVVKVKEGEKPFKQQVDKIACKSCLEKWGTLKAFGQVTHSGEQAIKHIAEYHYSCVSCSMSAIATDGHKEPLAKYCLSCAKKEGACPICGDKLEQKIGDQDKKWIKEGLCTGKDCCKGHIKDRRAHATCERCNKEDVYADFCHSPCQACAKELGICYHCQRKVKTREEIEDEKLREAILKHIDSVSPKPPVVKAKNELPTKCPTCDKDFKHIVLGEFKGDKRTGVKHALVCLSEKIYWVHTRDKDPTGSAQMIPSQFGPLPLPKIGDQDSGGVNEKLRKAILAVVEKQFKDADSTCDGSDKELIELAKPVLEKIDKAAGVEKASKDPLIKFFSVVRAKEESEKKGMAMSSVILLQQVFGGVHGSKHAHGSSVNKVTLQEKSAETTLHVGHIIYKITLEFDEKGVLQKINIKDTGMRCR